MIDQYPPEVFSLIIEHVSLCVSLDRDFYKLMRDIAASQI